MPNGYLGGLVEGFSGQREAQIARQLEQDAARRQQEAEIFKYLLQSQDPEMRALAMSGLFESAQPGKRKGGLAGYLGEIQGGRYYPMIRARMDEYTPDTREGVGGGPAPPSPGAAAMSTNQPVRAGSTPIAAPPPPGAEEGPEGIGADLPTAEEVFGALEPGGGPPEAPDLTSAAPGLGGPPPPPESRYKRRGTGVPTAEEIAEMQARVPLQSRLRLAQEMLPQLGGSQEDVLAAARGIFGAPAAAESFGAGPNVKLPDGRIVPTLRNNRTGHLVASDGSPLPSNVEAAPTAGRVPRSGREPDPTSLTGFSRVFYDTDTGAELYRIPDLYSPPPAYSGTAAVLSGTGDPTVIGVPRGGVPGGVIGAAPSPQPSVEQASAQALLADVQQRVTAEETPRLPGLPRRPLTPARRDQIVREAAVAAGLPYTTYFALEQATRIAPARQVAPRPGAPAGTGTQQPPTSAAGRIRQRALEIERGRSTPSTPPPLAPPTRMGGPGPRR